jgi:hypothetical protein
MNLLIDTQAFLWFVWMDPKLSTAANALMAGTNSRRPAVGVVGGVRRPAPSARRYSRAAVCKKPVLSDER